MIMTVQIRKGYQEMIKICPVNKNGNDWDSINIIQQLSNVQLKAIKKSLRYHQHQSITVKMIKKGLSRNG